MRKVLKMTKNTIVLRLEALDLDDRTKFVLKMSRAASYKRFPNKIHGNDKVCLLTKATRYIEGTHAYFDTWVS